MNENKQIIELEKKIAAARKWNEILEDRQAEAVYRDRFAAAALTGLLADGTYEEDAYETAARHAYGYADAMMEVRARRKELDAKKDNNPTDP